jgi:hypothetical protein
MAQQDYIVDLADFSKGFQASDDTTKAPFGSLRRMRNAQVTDRGGIAPRPGTLLLGTKSTSNYAVKGLYTFKKSFEENEILIKNYDGEMEGYSKNHTDQGWFRIKNGFTTDKEFGYTHSLYNVSNENLLVGGNQYDKFFSYTGSILRINGALVGGETSVTVDSTLLDDVYESKTATSNSATTLDVSTVTWAASQWVNFYVYITSGTNTGKIRKITANTATQITFDTLGSAPGNCTFEIRRILIPATGSIIYNGTVIAYTAVPTATTITVASAHAAPNNTLVTYVPTEYEANPRGNRFTNYLGRLIVGNVRSALHRDSAGNLQGQASGSAAFVSKLNNPLDYSYSATRVAGEGDLLSTPYGGGPITDVVAQENTAYIFKRDYIEAVVYSQDADDFAVREPLKPGAGSVGKTTRGNDDLYFFTPSKQFSSIGRVRSQDIRPQTQDIGFKINRWLDRADMSTVGRGVEVLGRVYIPMKSSSAADYNDVVLVYNRNSNSFEGIWDLPAFGIVEFNEGYYYGGSQSANVYKMFHTQNADVEGSTEYGYTFEVATHFFNLSSSKSYQQSMHGLTIEGYIRGGTTVTYNIWKDFSDNASVTFTFAADEDGYLDGEASSIFLGDAPLGINNLSVDYSDIDFDGRRHFSARIYFPYLYGSYFSLGASTSGVNQDVETTRFGLMLSEEPAINTNKVKSI